MAKVAFLGLGVMGYPMAGHLKNKGGHELTVYNRTTAKAEQWAKEFGGKVAKTPEEATSGQDFVMMCGMSYQRPGRVRSQSWARGLHQPACWPGHGPGVGDGYRETAGRL